MVRELDIGLSVHDASRLEWTVEAPIPVREAPVEIALEAEIPANAWSARDSFDHLQLLARLSGGGVGTGSPDTVDEIRRAALAGAQRCKRMRLHLERELATAAALFSQARRRTLEHEVLAAVEAALCELDTLREVIAEGPPEPAALRRERDLAAEFLSHQALELISSVQAAGSEVRSRLGELPLLHDGLAAALARELADRESRGLLRPRGEDPELLERYVERASLLKKHFQEVYFLRVEHSIMARRVRNWSGVAAAMLAALWAFPLGLLLTQGSILTFSAGFAWVVLLFAAMYAVKDRIKEVARGWLTSRFSSGLGSRVTTLLTRADTRLLRLREWMRSCPERRLDPLNPAAGATRPVVVLRYEGRGAVAGARTRASATHLRLVFRLDLSPLFARLDDPVRHVPVLGESGRELRLAPAARAYRIPLELRVRVGGESLCERRVLVAHKTGLARLEHPRGTSALEVPAALPV